METIKGLKSSSWSVVITELSRGRELAKQLQNHLDPSTSPHETREYLIQKILSTYNNLLLHMSSTPILPNFNNFTSFPSTMDPNSSQIIFHGGAPTSSQSPCSVSHCSVINENRQRASKRRKTSLPKWIKRVKMSTEEGGGGLEGTLNDGYSWRKYGQKVILGATFPRGYYRCTHRHTRGCCATKQVQKSTEDPTLCQVIYKGHHTCSQPSTSTKPTPVPGRGPEPPAAQQNRPQQEKQNNDHQTPAGFVQAPPPSLDIDNLFSAFLGTATGFASVSPATSDSSHLPGGNAGGGNGVWTPESDVNYEQGPQGGSSTGPDSPFGRLEFTLDELGIDPNFPFVDPEFF